MPTPSLAEANGTTLRYLRRGRGPSLLLIHGGGEDADMLEPQVQAFAASGYDVIAYDRRGTGASGREHWPGGGASRHADDAAALLVALGAAPATVVGVSSGGVIALVLAERHPDVVARVIAWEPPALGVIPGGPQMAGPLMAPAEEHLRDHPGDYAGAQALLLTLVLGFPVAVDDPEFEDARRNAEPMILDEPAVPLASFTAASFAGRDVTIAVGDRPNDVVAAAAPVLAHLAGVEVVRVQGGHEVYFEDPSVLTGIVGHPV